MYKVLQVWMLEDHVNCSILGYQGEFVASYENVWDVLVEPQGDIVMVKEPTRNVQL